MPDWTYDNAVFAFFNLVASFVSDDERGSESIALRSADPLSLFIYQSYIELTWLELILLEPVRAKFVALLSYTDSKVDFCRIKVLSKFKSKIGKFIFILKLVKE